MADIVLVALNARYAHSAFGLRYLVANLGALRDRARILEFDIRKKTEDVLTAVRSENPRVVAIGVHVWNAVESECLAAALKSARPDVALVLGGPEISHETDAQPIAALADCVVAGEADLVFSDVCRALLAGKRPEPRVIRAEPPDLARVALPYDLYTDEDIAHRVLYVESTRGCAFGCEFCLSAVERSVRSFPLEPFLASMERLLARGAKRFKFVDRTFNLDPDRAQAILRFFRERFRPGMFVHFEVVPDRFSRDLRDEIAKFPPGALQLEVGVQTFDAAVARRIGRAQDADKVEENLRFLRAETGAYVHADLIAGLPGETADGFGAGFDRLMALGPHEIQIELLKRLRGAPIARHAEPFGMQFSPHPPYEVIETHDVPRDKMDALRRMARYWDLVWNSGNFPTSAPLVWGDGSPYAGFCAFSEWLHGQLGRVHEIDLAVLAEHLMRYLVEVRGMSKESAGRAVGSDYVHGGLRRPPKFLGDIPWSDGGMNRPFDRHLKRQSNRG